MFENNFRFKLQRVIKIVWIFSDSVHWKISNFFLHSLISLIFETVFNLLKLLSYKLVFMSSIWKLNLFLTSDTWINVCSKVTLVKRSCQMFPLRLNLLKIVMRQTATAYQDRVNFHSLRILTLQKRWNAQRLKFSLSILARDETIYVRFKHLSILSQGF